VIEVVELDQFARAIFLEIPPSEVVLLQAIFESYEGVATVRTIDLKRSLVCLVTTVGLLETTIEVLRGVATLLNWRAVPAPPADEYISNDFNFAAKKLRKINLTKEELV